MASAALPELALQPRDYRDWRERKLAGYPKNAGELVVEVRDPRKLSAAERTAILEHCSRVNMAVYASRCGEEADKEIPRALGLQFGLSRLDPNWLADDDGISSIAVCEDATRGEFTQMTGLASRSADRTLAALLRRGLLESDSSKGAVRVGLPLDALAYYFPRLYPEAAT